MRLNEIEYNDSQPIDAYGPGYFKVGGQRFDGPVLVAPDGVVAWGGLTDIDTLLAMKDSVDVVFVGTGAEIAHLPADLRQALDAAGIGAEPMASPSACRTFNILLSEGRRVAAALIPC